MDIYIGDILKRIRSEYHLSQKEVAKRLGYAPSTISRFESNQNPVRYPFIEEFIEKLNLTEADAFHLKSSFLNKHNIKKDWGTCRNVLHFYGREAELTKLSNWVSDPQINLIAILGMGGIGKTSLAAQFAKSNEGPFAQIICRDLTNPYDALDFVNDLTSSLSDEPVDNPNNLGQAMLELISILREKMCFILLDNFESVMDIHEAGRFSPEFQEYHTMLRALAIGEHQSTVVLTSRHLPEFLSPHKGGMVQLLTLDGLDEEACQTLLDEKGLEVSKDLSTLIERFSGNPLALEFIGDLIRDSYQGDVGTYLKEWPGIQELLFDILPKHLKGYSPDEIEILLWLAIKRQPLSSNMLNQLIEPKLGVGNIGILIRKLTNRSLIQSEPHGFALHNMIMDYMLTHLQKMIFKELEEGAYECLNQFNLLDTKAPEYIQRAQKRDMLEPISQHLQRQFGSQQKAQKALLSLLSRSQKGDVKLTPRYFAGNIVNLLIEMDTNLAELDLSDLQLRHVDFRGVDLQEVNLSNAILQDCLFQEMFGHVLEVSFSPNGRFYAIATANGQIHIWDARTDQKVQILDVDSNWVRSFDWHSKKPWLVTASSGQSTPKIKVWDIQTGQEHLSVEGHNSRIRSIKYAKQGQYIISGSEDHTVKIWDKAGQLLKTLPHKNVSIWTVATHPTETLIASAGADNSIWLWDYEIGKVVKQLEGHTGWISDVTFNKDGSKLASASQDGTVRIWDVEHGDSLQPLQGHVGWVRSITFIDIKNQLATTGADGTLRLWDVRYQKPLQTVRAHDALVESVAASPDGKRLITGSQNNEVRIWEGTQCIQRLIGHKNPMWSAQFSSDGRTLVSGSSDGKIREWLLNGEDEPTIFEGHSDWVKSVVYHPTLPLLASGSSDCKVILWNRKTGQPETILEGHTSWISAVDISPNGRFLASCSGDGTVQIRNGRSGDIEHVLSDANGRLFMVKFSPTSQFIVSSNDKDTIIVWETRTGNQLAVLEKHTENIYALAFSEDEHFLYTGGDDGQLVIWDTDKWRHHETVIFTNSSSILFIAVQPFGRLLALGMLDGSTRLFDTKTKQIVEIFSVGTQPIWCVAFSPDGQMLASCGDSEKIQLWDIHSRALIKQLHV
ncbi:MAG: NB-ARC domain-containing protein, partial [Chloroflexota bacterium]